MSAELGGKDVIYNFFKPEDCLYQFSTCWREQGRLKRRQSCTRTRGLSHMKIRNSLQLSSWHYTVLLPLRTLRPIYRTGVPLPSKCCILYIFSTNISRPTEYFKHAAHTPFFSSKCRLFYNANFFRCCIIHILHTRRAKI
jgi:hypothetical protein